VRLIETSVSGAFVVEPEPIEDERGAFARIFCDQEFGALGLQVHFAQWSISRNTRRNTLRGMHYSVGSHAETKLVRATRGAVHDVIIDLRQDSPTYLKSFGTTLDATAGTSLYIPAGVAHGFQTLIDDTEVTYHIDPAFVDGAARGVRWNDPAFGIAWPETSERIISQRDANYPDYQS
jgi:dTDP-4-dehydrorhamnose 3,5-epimerase